MSQEAGIDLAFQEDTVYRRNRRLVCFDMDSTLIQAEVIDELAKEAGVADEVIAITEEAMQGNIDFTQSLRRRVSLLKGLDVGALEIVAERLKLNEGAKELTEVLHKLGYQIAIISGGFDYFGHYLKSKLSIDYVFANQLEIVDGKLTGEVLGEVVDARGKASILQSIANDLNIDLKQVIAVGDGANDLQMLSLAGLGVAFRAKPKVSQSAKQNIDQLGLQGILYMLGVHDVDKQELLQLS